MITPFLLALMVASALAFPFSSSFSSVSLSAHTKRKPAGDGSPLSNGVSYLTTINDWRVKYDKSPMTWSANMADAADNTGKMNGGVCDENMEHYPAENAAEVIGPGSDRAMGKNLHGRSPFEISMLGWLCEGFDNPELQREGACQDQESVMKVIKGGTGHHDILLDDAYSQIGCAFTPNSLGNDGFGGQGMWVCDLTW